MEWPHIHNVGDMPGVACGISDVDDIFEIDVDEALSSVEEPRMYTRPDDKTLLDLLEFLDLASPDDETLLDLLKFLNLAAPHSAVDFLLEACSLSQAALDKALILACQHGFKYLVHKLIQLGADIECRNALWETPLLICVENRYIDLVRFLVARGADVKAVDWAGNNALILSISFAGSKEMTQFFLQKADVLINHQNQDGYTAVMKALEVMDVGAVYLLLEGYLSERFSGQSSQTYQNDSDWALLDQTVNCKGETAQQIAEKYGLGNVFTLLKECLSTKSKPIQVAVGSRDLETLNFILDSDIAEKKDMGFALFQLFREHSENKGHAFTNVEKTMIIKLVECGANLKSIASAYGKPKPIHLSFAVDVGDYNYKLVEVFCKYGAPLNQPKNGNESLPLSLAAKHGRMDLMELLLEYNAEINTNSFNNSPLDCALSHGHIDCARFLADQGAKVDIALALKSAVKSQVPECMKFLFEDYESDIIKYFIEVPKSGNILLSEAVRGGNQEIIEQILQAGVDINEPQSSGETPIVKSKNGAVAQFLIFRGADVNRVTNSTMRTPLMYVLQYAVFTFMYDNHDCLKEVILVLLENGACVNARTSNGRTPLMLAAAVRGQADILQMLLDHGADCTDRDKNGNTALIHAIIKGYPDNVNLLIQFMENNLDLLIVQHNRGLTDLMYAVLHRRWDIALKLIDSRADVYMTDANGNTALLLAISSSLPESILDSLIRAGCNVNHQNNAGLSPLMLAVQQYHYRSTVSLLLAVGADVNAVNHKDTSKTALTYFTSFLNRDAITCLEALLDRGANASYLSPCCLSTIISTKSYTQIPKLIRCGLAPFVYKFDEMPWWLQDDVLKLPSVSPLCLALLTGKATLARYFWENLFLTNLDLSLASDNDVRQFLQQKGYEDCLSFRDVIGSQPMPLFGMCIVAVSSAVGAYPGREARVHQLPLPCLLKDLLLFKSEVVNMAQPQSRDDNLGIPGLGGVGEDFQVYFGCNNYSEDDEYLSEQYSD